MSFSRFATRCCLSRRLPFPWLLSHSSAALPISQGRLFGSKGTETSQTQARDTCRKYFFARLNDRSIIRISGSETCDFLQGLLTNDIRHLLDNHTTSVSLRCIYGFILNTSGRIVVDLFLYSYPSRNDELLLEVDSQLAPQVMSLLKRYKIRRKITIDASQNIQVLAVYPERPQNVQQNLHIQSASSERFVVQDPRNYHFGYRVLSHQPDTSNISSIMMAENEFFNDTTFSESNAEHYRTFRYQLGIGEGSIDFPPESVFPFEANAEILNGISFTKGCYIGQELTARTYHTGVIRKRMLPIELTSTNDSNADFSSPIAIQNVLNSEGKLMGKFRANQQRNGIAVLKFAEILTPEGEQALLQLSQSKRVSLRACRPFWWPESIMAQPI